MSDVNVEHKFQPNRKGICQTMVGGRKRGYKLCHLPKDAEAHTRWATHEQEADEEAAKHTQIVYSVPYDHTTSKWHTLTLRELHEELQYNFERGVDHVPLATVLRLVLILEDLMQGEIL